jgi:hypothetical protein
MGLIIKNKLSSEQYHQLQILKGEIEESSPAQSYIRVVYSAPHQLEVQVTSQSLCWQVTQGADSFEDLIKEVRSLFKARIKQWHNERNL